METWNHDQITSAAAKMQAKITTLTAKLAEARQAFGTLQPYADAPLSKIGISADNWRRAELAYQESIPICAANDAAKVANEKLIRKLVAAITAAGITRSTRKRKARSQWKTEEVNCEWYSLLIAAAPSYPHTSTWLADLWKRFVAIHEADEAKRKAAREARERAYEAARREKIKLATQVLAASEIGLDPMTASLDDMIEAVRKKDKYLDLAAAMMDTRGDWSDGFYRVEYALGRFNADTPMDKEIYYAVHAAVHSGEEDGRIFRDLGEFGYDAILKLADPKWVEIYGRLKGIE
jgi:hypothetical protein